ncbi:hypothetical protein RRG08_013862 [Elysia crispata]|uniref:Uncharacterized protein n=1 Tax=Elysia crispata TaxID=231223 RepID=A0AAE0YLV6_9GAST|nr:hypothetical protein RRG08_013862 [Elysia crispata]
MSGPYACQIVTRPSRSIDSLKSEEISVHCSGSRQTHHRARGLLFDHRKNGGSKDTADGAGVAMSRSPGELHGAAWCLHAFSRTRDSVHVFDGLVWDGRQWVFHEILVILMSKGPSQFSKESHLSRQGSRCLTEAVILSILVDIHRYQHRTSEYQL